MFSAADLQSGLQKVRDKAKISKKQGSISSTDKRKAVETVKKRIPILKKQSHSGNIVFVTANACALNTNNSKILDPYVIKNVSSNSKDGVNICFSPRQISFVESYCLSKGVAIESNDSGEGQQNYIHVRSRKEAEELIKGDLYQAEISMCNLEEWYENILALENMPQATIPTKFIPLNDDDVKALSAAFVCAEGEHRLRPEENTLLSALQNKIEQEMASAWEKDSYFCKLSTRSPKDSLVVQQKLREWLNTTGQSEEELDATELISQKYSLMKVSSSSEVVDLLGSSYRVYCDLLWWQKYRIEDTPNENMNIILRKWCEIKAEEEFRCFVFDGKITGISQYFCYKVFGSLQDAKTVATIKKRILTFFNSIKSSISLPHYVLDVAVTPSLVFAIEVNPLRTSGSSLFEWEADFETLCTSTLKSEEAIPIRVLSKLLDDE